MIYITIVAILMPLYSNFKILNLVSIKAIFAIVTQIWLLKKKYRYT